MLIVFLSVLGVPAGKYLLGREGELSPGWVFFYFTFGSFFVLGALIKWLIVTFQAKGILFLVVAGILLGIYGRCTGWLDR